MARFKGFQAQAVGDNKYNVVADVLQWRTARLANVVTLKDLSPNLRDLVTVRMNAKELDRLYEWCRVKGVDISIDEGRHRRRDISTNPLNEFGRETPDGEFIGTNRTRFLKVVRARGVTMLPSRLRQNETVYVRSTPTEDEMVAIHRVTRGGEQYYVRRDLGLGVRKQRSMSMTCSRCKRVAGECRCGDNPPHRFREGDVIRLDGFDSYSGIPQGATGVVLKIAGARGVSERFDPVGMLVYAHWYGGRQDSVAAGLCKKIGHVDVPAIRRKPYMTHAQETAAKNKALIERFNAWVVKGLQRSERS